MLPKFLSLFWAPSKSPELLSPWREKTRVWREGGARFGHSVQSPLFPSPSPGMPFPQRGIHAHTLKAACPTLREELFLKRALRSKKSDRTGGKRKVAWRIDGGRRSLSPFLRLRA